MDLPVVIKLVTPVPSFAFISVASCPLLNFFPHTICMKYALMDVILIIKLIKPNEYENTQHMILQYLMESILSSRSKANY